MSAVIEVAQNESGTWTAKGQYGDIYAEVTCKDQKKALLALNRAFFDFQPARKGGSNERPAD